MRFIKRARRLLYKTLMKLPAPVRRRVYLARCDLEESNEQLGSINYFVASEVEDFERAMRLVHDAYVDCSYIKANESGVRVRPADLLPTTLQIVAKSKDEIIATMTLILDSVLGLPLDEAFKKEANKLRDKNLKIAEISNLTVKKEFRNAGLLLRLGRSIEHYALAAGCEKLLVAVSPHLTSFYQDVLLFKKIGKVRSYSPKCYDPVVLLAKDCRSLEADYNQVYAGLPDKFNGIAFWNNIKRNSELYSSITDAGRNPRLKVNEVRKFVFENTDIFLTSSLSKISSLLSKYSTENTGVELPKEQAKQTEIFEHTLDRVSFHLLLSNIQSETKAQQKPKKKSKMKIGVTRDSEDSLLLTPAEERRDNFPLEIEYPSNKFLN